MHPLTADRLYGGAALSAPAASITPGKVAGGDSPLRSPDPSAAPAAAGGRTPQNMSELVNDPTFWLVATLGAVVALAAASA